MLNRTYRHLMAAAVALSLCAGGAFSGEKGNKSERGERNGKLGGTPMIDHVLKHEKELALTAEQKKKFEALKDKAEALQEKMRKDPEARELFKEVAQARKSGNEEKLRELQTKVKELAARKGSSEEITGEGLRLLTPEQMAKLKDLRDEGPMAMRDGKDGGKKAASAGTKPDPSKGAPSLYDNEK
ncbi:MAG TPA: Spy/CpxP family protein refolding chaperone [Planctomycetota bacterium]|nr:Spy/CpxP family protein refolding chaperone [Planctomycetota bacterium]